MGRRLFLLLALVFLVGNLFFRTLTLQVLAPFWVHAFTVPVVLAAGACVLRPQLRPPALTLFGASFFLYGFHSYRIQSQLFEYVTTCFALAFVLSNARHGRRMGEGSWVVRFLLLYLLLALLSLLLLPGQVIGHALLLRGSRLAEDILTAFPSDPLYAFAGVNRLALFVLFASQLALLEEAPRLYRALLRGIAWSLLAAVALGLLDYADIVPLTAYNLSEAFYGLRHPRLQSTFGNPTWYSCFLACATPFLAMEFLEGTPRVRAFLLLFLPFYGASLFLAASRASWLVCALVAVGLLVWLRRQGHESRPLRFPWVRALSAAGATALVIALLAFATFHAAGSSGAVGRRLLGLADAIRSRGVLWSPRAAAAAYASGMASESPWFGLGYETYKLHLESLLSVPASGVAEVSSMGEEFDDAHSTYLQTLVSTGATGLLVWLALSTAVLITLLNDIRQGGSLLSVAMLLSTAAFHLYGFFQGMQYIPVIWMFFALGGGYALCIEGRTRSAAPRAFRPASRLLAVLVACAAVFYFNNRGFRQIKQKYGLSAYLPSEKAEFEGFYYVEKWPQGEFRWMGRRGIINVRRVAPFELVVLCGHPDLEREPVLLSFSFNGRPAGSLMFRRPGLLQHRFEPTEAGTLLLTVSRTWRPREQGSGRDRRELGVAVGALVWPTSRS